MRTEHYIEELLYRYNCVVVPEFGAFLAHTASARIDSVSNTLHPPTKVISFNEQLSKNDGLLVSHISKAKNLSYEDLLEEVITTSKNWSEESVFRPWLKYAAVFLLLCATGVSGYQFYNKNLEKQELVQQDAQEEVSQYIGTNKFGLHQVAYSSFSDSREALRFLRKIKQTVSQDAWMLSEK